MGHVLGFGTVWMNNGLLEGDCSYALSSKASQEFQALSGCNTAVPLENDGGEGTECRHWEEDCYIDEVMTGFRSGLLPLSRTSIASFEDLGYQVNHSHSGKTAVICLIYIILIHILRHTAGKLQCSRPVST